MWLFQLSGLSQQKQNTLEGSFKKGIVDVLGHGRQTGEKYLVYHAHCQKLGTNHGAVICEAVVFTIQTARRSLKFGTQRFDRGRYRSYKTTRGRRTFIQRQSQSTVMGEEKIAAELMNVEHSELKTTSGRKTIKDVKTIKQGTIKQGCENNPDTN